jgi:hypothetical protein
VTSAPRIDVRRLWREYREAKQFSSGWRWLGHETVPRWFLEELGLTGDAATESRSSPGASTRLSRQLDRAEAECRAGHCRLTGSDARP